MARALEGREAAAPRRSGVSRWAANRISREGHLGPGALRAAGSFSRRLEARISGARRVRASTGLVCYRRAFQTTCGAARRLASHSGTHLREKSAVAPPGVTGAGSTARAEISCARQGCTCGHACLPVRRPPVGELHLPVSSPLPASSAPAWALRAVTTARTVKCCTEVNHLKQPLLCALLRAPTIVALQVHLQRTL